MSFTLALATTGGAAWAENPHALTSIDFVSTVQGTDIFFHTGSIVPYRVLETASDRMVLEVEQVSPERTVKTNFANANNIQQIILQPVGAHKVRLTVRGRHLGVPNVSFRENGQNTAQSVAAFKQPAALTDSRPQGGVAEQALFHPDTHQAAVGRVPSQGLGKVSAAKTDAKTGIRPTTVAAQTNPAAIGKPTMLPSKAVAAATDRTSLKAAAVVKNPSSAAQKNAPANKALADKVLANKALADTAISSAHLSNAQAQLAVAEVSPAPPTGEESPLAPSVGASEATAALPTQHNHPAAGANSPFAQAAETPHSGSISMENWPSNLEGESPPPEDSNNAEDWSSFIGNALDLWQSAVEQTGGTLIPLAGLGGLLLLLGGTLIWKFRQLSGADGQTSPYGDSSGFQAFRHQYQQQLAQWNEAPEEDRANTPWNDRRLAGHTAAPIGLHGLLHNQEAPELSQTERMRASQAVSLPASKAAALRKQANAQGGKSLQEKALSADNASQANTSLNRRNLQQNNRRNQSAPQTWAQPQPTLAERLAAAANGSPMPTANGSTNRVAPVQQALHAYKKQNTNVDRNSTKAAFNASQPASPLLEKPAAPTPNKQPGSSSAGKPGIQKAIFPTVERTISHNDAQRHIAGPSGNSSPNQSNPKPDKTTPNKPKVPASKGIAGTTGTSTPNSPNSRPAPGKNDGGNPAVLDFLRSVADIMEKEGNLQMARSIQKNLQ
ncbi:MAG: hypothetical protein SFZ03_11440 [Candidatus Melainabacteria bacterium]|nr:hypothetical protein [Candidatus Melainabacteria bacterium]